MNMGSQEVTLALDIGGTWSKATLLDPAGKTLTPIKRIRTPQEGMPKALLISLQELSQEMGAFTRASIGFPGVVLEGVTQCAANLQGDWRGYPLAKELESLLKVPTRVANDADIQGLGAIEGKGVELVLTLGTGLGSSLFSEGRLLPNCEFGHLPSGYRNNENKALSFENRLSDQVLKSIGQEAWKDRVLETLSIFFATFNPTKIYLGGGNARFFQDAENLPSQIVVVPNETGLLGGIALWKET
jgi:polyphosphate glucokinase